MAEKETGPGADARGSVFQALQADDPARLGEYVLVARLGAGGMGTVYLSHTRAGRPVAIKAIRPKLADDPNFRRRFRHEVAAAGRVHGLYTPSVIDSEIDVAPLWLATAFVQGPTLSAAVSRHGTLPLSSVLLLAAGVAEALQAVHGAGIVHRDLKASNVLLASDGPRVIDFGIAYTVDATALTHTGAAVGTPPFMSPEQALEKNIGPATDVFSLGQLITYAAKGTPAFGEGQAHGVLYRIVHEEPDLTDVPEPLLPLLNRCLAKDPDKRPTPAEVIDMCRAASEDGTLQRTGNWLPAGINADLTRHRDVPPQAPTTHRPEVNGDAPIGTGPGAGPAAAPSKKSTPQPPGPVPPESWERPGAVAGSEAPHALAGTSAPARKPIPRRAALALGAALLAGAGGTTAFIGLREDSGADDSRSDARNPRRATSKKLTAKATASLTGHTDEVSSVAFSPDSKTLATTGGDETVRLWNVKTGKVATTLNNREGWFVPAAFSPDGTTLATGGRDDTACLWSLESGTTTVTFTGHKDSVWSVAFSPDGTTLATGSSDGTVRLWNAETGRTRVTLTGHKDSVWSVAFSPDGTTLATGGEDKTARLWNVRTGKATATLTGHTSNVVSVAFNPNGKTMATGSTDGTTRLWNARTGKPTSTLTSPDGAIHSVAFSPDGRNLAAGSIYGTVRLTNTETGGTTAILTQPKFAIGSVAFSPDGKTMATGSDDGTARLWQASGGARFSARVDG